VCATLTYQQPHHPATTFTTKYFYCLQGRKKMTRGAQREKDRERAAARSKKLAPSAKKGAKREDGKTDAERMAEKKASKEKLKADGKLKERKAGGEKNPFAGQKKTVKAINPHTGKSDPAWAAKQAKKK
jgi:hypothetical protein